MSENFSFNQYGSVTLYCQHCKKAPILMNGGGMPIKLETLIKGSSPKRKKELLEATKKHTITYHHHHHKIMECTSCNILSSKFFIILFDGQSTEPVYTPTFNCWKCSTALSPATKPPQEYCCASCGQQRLAPRYDEMLWD
ncbi:MAG: hypothetical protein COA63_003160 [Methylophaga sp.]|nr:hypothetical protein [Methylophaga sp.]